MVLQADFERLEIMQEQLMTVMSHKTHKKKTFLFQL